MGTLSPGGPEAAGWMRGRPEEGWCCPPEGTAALGAGLSLAEAVVGARGHAGSSSRREGARGGARPRSRTDGRPCGVGGKAAAAAAGRRLPLGATAALGSPVRGEGREGSWTRRRFMGLSGEQVPPRAAHCLAGLTMGLLQPQGRPPPRPATCAGARAPGRRGPAVRPPSVRRSVVRSSGRQSARPPRSRRRGAGPVRPASVPEHGLSARPAGSPRPDVCSRPWRPLLLRRRAGTRLCSAGTARAAASRAHTQGPILPGSAQPYGKSASTQQPPLIQAQNVPQQGTITTLFASIMDANGREKKII